MTDLRPFQKRFVAAALRPHVGTAALSLPRGNGKSWLAAHLLTRALTPSDELHQADAEYLLCAGSIEQARLCFRFVRAWLEPTKATAIVYRMGRPGIRTACHPTWGQVGIDDIYSDSRSGQRHFSVHLLVGDKVLIVQPAAYGLLEFKVA